GIDRSVDLDHAAFDLGHRSFVFFLQAARQHDVRVAGGVVQEEIDGDVELEFFERTLDERVVGQRDARVEADREQPLDFPRIDLSEDLVSVDAGTRQVLLLYSPDAGDVPAVLWIADVAPAGQLIAFLPVFASALSVCLAGDRAVAALGFPEATACEHEVYGAERIL